MIVPSIALSASAKLSARILTGFGLAVLAQKFHTRLRLTHLPRPRSEIRRSFRKNFDQVCRLAKYSQHEPGGSAGLGIHLFLSQLQGPQDARKESPASVADAKFM